MNAFTSVKSVTVILVIAAAWLYGFTSMLMDRPVSLPSGESSPIVWHIKKGSNLDQVSKNLSFENILSQPRLVYFYARAINQIDIKAGEYWIEDGDTPRSLLEKFNNGKVIQRSITFPEGWSFIQWINHMSAIEQFSSELDIDELIASLSIKQQSPEGLFFPDTYSYTQSDSVIDVLNVAYAKMNKILADEWKLRAPDLPYDTPYEALIMASIIEKETGLISERSDISGVFMRRLKLGMRLQTDPTVIYGLGRNFDGDLKRSDLKNYSSYNTYMINGLPPTPIAMPSSGAIRAALHPGKGSSLYFVARGDGGHYFSDTLEEHSSAVKRFQIDKRAKNYQSAPN
jgi:UPF0755 protein